VQVKFHLSGKKNSVQNGSSACCFGHATGGSYGTTTGGRLPCCAGKSTGNTRASCDGRKYAASERRA
jgi:hypothetical protein